MPTRTLYAAAVLFLIVATQPGCEASTDMGSTNAIDLHNDALRAATTLDAATVVTYVAAYFAGAGDVSMRDISATEASPQVVMQMQARVKADLADTACLTVATNDTTYIELTFNHCVGAHGKLQMTGTVSAQIAFETQACGPASCPIAVTYSVNTTDLQIGESAIIGDWLVRDPLAIDQPYTWEGLVAVQTPARGIVFTSAASFTQSDDCVDVSVDSTIGGSGQRSFTCSGESLHRCMNACPSAGTVSVTTQDGDTLTWSYDGSTSAAVTPDGDEAFSVGLTCSS